MIAHLMDLKSWSRLYRPYTFEMGILFKRVWKRIYFHHVFFFVYFICRLIYVFIYSLINWNFFKDLLPRDYIIIHFPDPHCIMFLFNLFCVWLSMMESFETFWAWPWILIILHRFRRIRWRMHQKWKTSM